ncbi:choline oxidase [Actinomycetospora sp. NBRC 106375]|uniref:GMC family oxidoreductase n=1 Tax=Actinomycetospora sp. NBRC 106375 TaxID=3032207 RepID=UPI0024A41ECF|nr:GMC oxidoreductase [Actinomycetospora sp. NBRC 106375]GLZ44022.1 choline oxidase [Actinomycetospora sp. NBRC 106375]
MAGPQSSGNEFDYVVVGGGTAGCAVASRLSEDRDVSVCLIEAGPSDVGDDAILDLSRWMELLESGYDWDYPIEPQESGNSWMRHARARVLGGCSSHNSAIAFWAPKENLDDWAAGGATGWTADECYPFYRKLETALDTTAEAEAPGRGTDGPVTIRTVGDKDPCGEALLEACEQVGLPVTPFNTGRTVHRGANWFQVNAKTDGSRSSASVAYIHPNLDRPNLTLMTGYRAEKLNLDTSGARPRATGARLRTPDTRHAVDVTARREVILSAGAIDGPKLLMLSGIGPAAHLRDIGIDVVVDAPGVGENLQDHPEGLVQWEALQPMPTASTQWWQIGIFAGAEGRATPDLMFHYGSVPFDMNIVRHGYPTADNTFCLTPNVTGAQSKGTVRLSSRDFHDKPKVDPRYFSHDHDREVMIRGIKVAREIAGAPALKEWVGTELAPGDAAQSDEELFEYIKNTHNTVYHPSCTVKMGADGDPLAPVDPQLRVRGVDGLRVADGSIMPDLITVNPCITTMMIGERCADFIKNPR